MAQKNYLPLFLLIASSLLLFSCQDSVTSFDEQPPQLPPLESMDVDLSAFEEESGNKSANFTAENESYTHFLNATFRAMIVRGVVNSSLAIPKALLEAAENIEPELSDDGEWTWSYSKDANGNNFEAELIATANDNDQVIWQMYVTSSALNIDNALLFEGEVLTDGSSGNWTYFALLGDEAGSETSNVTWTVESEDQVDLRLEVLSDRNGNLGDYIEYTFDSPIKRAVYYNAAEDETAEIEWNIETLEGYIIAPNYNNGEQACWNSNFQNVECS